MEEKQVKNRKKQIVIKIVLFLCVTFFVMLTIMHISAIRMFGTEPFTTKKYEDSSIFIKDFELSITEIEQAVYWGVWEDNVKEQEFSSVNRWDTNIEYIADIVTRWGWHFELSNFEQGTDLQQKKEQWMLFPHYYICELNKKALTNVGNLQNHGFQADQNKLQELTVYVRINDFSKNDKFKMHKEEYEKYSKYGIPTLIMGGILLVFSIGLLIYLIKKEAKEKKTFWDKSYYEGFFLILLVLLFFSTLAFRNIQYSPIGSIIMYSIDYYVISQMLFCFVRQVKRKEQFKNFLFVSILRNIKQKVVLRVIFSFVIVSFLSLGIILSFPYFIPNIVKLGIGMIYFAVWYFVFKDAVEYTKIEQQMEKLAKGNYTEQFHTKSKLFAHLISQMNSVQEGMKLAVEEKLRAERLKTDLITNVSHDLRTPLTSILNYIKLLKKEPNQREKITQYIDILDKNAQRLKTMTEDLMEISKVSSGNEKVVWETLDLVEMVRQANGEFAEAFAKKKLEIISDFYQQEILLSLDSKKFWRVLENLYGNIAKYALENTRVYVAIQKKEETIELSIMNISKTRLNVSSQDLIERFYQGESSRTSEGSGLGLSIVQGLVELQQGSFTIQIEGDCFKAIISLPYEKS